MKRSNHWPWLALLAVLPAPVHGEPALAVSAAQRQALAIELHEVGRSAPELSHPVLARVVVDDSHQRVLTLPVAGTIERLDALPGARVSAGDPLGLIRSREALAVQRDYLGAADRLERSRSAWQRDDALYSGGVIAAKRWQQTRAQWRQDESRLLEIASLLRDIGLGEADLQTLRRTRELRAVLPLRAPIAGAVLDRGPEPGQSFSAGQELFHLGDPERLWLSASVPPALALRTGSGDGVYRDGVLLGRVLQIGAAVAARSQAVPLTAEISAADTGLLPGQALQLQLTLQASTGLWLPRDSVVSLRGGMVVFVSTSRGFAVRTVRVAPALDGWTALAGIAAGEQVAATGSAALKGLAMGLGKGPGDAP